MSDEAQDQSQQVEVGSVLQEQEHLDLDQGTWELRQMSRLFWAQACTWEGIHPNSPMVVFSKENPYQSRYERTYRAWRDLRYPPEPEETEKEE